MKHVTKQRCIGCENNGKQNQFKFQFHPTAIFEDFSLLFLGSILSDESYWKKKICAKCNCQFS